jgi:uncharacterized protein (UPF0276 family)
MTPLGVGFVLHASEKYLSLCRDIIEDEAEFLELAPETLWSADLGRQLTPNSWSGVMDEIHKRSGKPFVAHGLGLSPGTASHDEERFQRWLEAIRRDQQVFEFRWYTEHLGWVQSRGMEVNLPLPLPPTADAVTIVAQRLNQLRPIVPNVGFENQVAFLTFGDVRAEPLFWNRICSEGNLWLLLDLHNCYTQCLNNKVPLEDYLANVDLTRVLEVHLSGGSESEPDWLPSGRVMRMDSHDGPVPEAVWEAFRQIRPRCPNLRGVVVERLDADLSRVDVPPLREEVCRARRIFWES